MLIECDVTCVERVRDFFVVYASARCAPVLETHRIYEVIAETDDGSERTFALFVFPRKFVLSLSARPCSARIRLRLSDAVA